MEFRTGFSRYYKRPDLIFGDRYVSANGNDDNDGLTRETAWATFTKLSTWLNSQTDNKTAVILAGNYGLSVGEMFLDNSADCEITIDFESGVSVDTSSTSTRLAGISVSSGATRWVLNLRGASFTGATVGGANGLSFDNNVNVQVNGASENGDLAQFSGYDDGVSGHFVSGSASQTVINDCRFFSCGKSPIFHVHSFAATHRRCVFEKDSATSGLGGCDAPGSIFEDCVFIANGYSPFRINSTTMQRCIIGDVNNSVTLSGPPSTGHDAGESLLEDCFLNVGGAAPTDTRIFAAGMVFRRCYGSLVMRERSGDTNIGGLIEHCHFNEFTINRNAELGHTKMVLRDNVFQNGTIGSGFSTAQGNAWDADSVIEFNCLFNTSISPEITIAANNLTVDPVVGSANTTNQKDWVIMVGSPCIGAASDGKNIGFSLEDIVE